MSRDRFPAQYCARKLAAPERLRIVLFLQGGSRNVGQIACMLRTAAVNVAHHMHVLVDAGLAQREKKGRFVLYSLPPGVLEIDTQGGRHNHLNLGCCRLELLPDAALAAEGD